MTRSSHNWQQLPGSFDVLHAALMFESDGNDYGIPNVPHAPFSYIPQALVAYRARRSASTSVQHFAVHFFLDDYRFESVWNRPNKALVALKSYRTLLTPDFSLYADYPLALQLWNTYRSRWCGAYWQHRGFQVIPTLSWSTPESYIFCFAGVPQRSLVAISTVGVRQQDRALFDHGYRELIAHLCPSRVLCYGKLPVELEHLAEVKYYAPQRERLRSAATA